MITTKKFNLGQWALSFTAIDGIITCLSLAVLMYQGKAVVDGFSLTFLGFMILATGILSYFAVILRRN